MDVPDKCQIVYVLSISLKKKKNFMQFNCTYRITY